MSGFRRIEVELVRVWVMKAVWKRAGKGVKKRIVNGRKAGRGMVGKEVGESEGR